MLVHVHPHYTHMHTHAHMHIHTHTHAHSHTHLYMSENAGGAGIQRVGEDHVQLWPQGRLQGQLPQPSSHVLPAGPTPGGNIMTTRQSAPACPQCFIQKLFKGGGG